MLATQKIGLKHLTKGENKIELLQNHFIASQDVKSSSKMLYSRTLKQYFKWVEESSYNLGEITRVELLQYKESLLNSGRSSLTVGSYITVVRKFYEYTEANKLYPNVAKGIKTPKRKQQFKKQPLSIPQGKELLEYTHNLSLRDRALVNLLIRTGLRTIEVVRANIEDITYKGGVRVLLVHGKGREEKDNFVILTDKTYKPIEEYLTTREEAKDIDPLFISTSNNSKGKALTTRTVSKVAKEAIKAIGLDSKEFTAHSLRHTTAVNILRAGGSLNDAQSVLRHANPATTQIYTSTIEEELRLKNGAEKLIDSIL